MFNGLIDFPSQNIKSLSFSVGMSFDLLKVSGFSSWLHNSDWCLSKRRSWKRIGWVITVRLSKAWMVPIVRSISGFQRPRWAWLHNYVCKASLWGQQVLHTRAIIYCGQHRIHYWINRAIACAGDKPHYPPQYLQCEWKLLTFHFQLWPMC